MSYKNKVLLVVTVVWWLLVIVAECLSQTTGNTNHIDVVHVGGAILLWLVALVAVYVHLFHQEHWDFNAELRKRARNKNHFRPNAYIKVPSPPEKGSRKRGIDAVLVETYLESYPEKGACRLVTFAETDAAKTYYNDYLGRKVLHSIPCTMGTVSSFPAEDGGKLLMLEVTLSDPADFRLLCEKSRSEYLNFKFHYIVRSRQLFYPMLIPV